MEIIFIAKYIHTWTKPLTLGLLPFAYLCNTRTVSSCLLSNPDTWERLPVCSQENTSAVRKSDLFQVTWMVSGKVVIRTQISQNTKPVLCLCDPTSLQTTPSEWGGWDDGEGSKASKTALYYCHLLLPLMRWQTPASPLISVERAESPKASSFLHLRLPAFHFLSFRALGCASLHWKEEF